jgi:hypothetical protein
VGNLYFGCLSTSADSPQSTPVPSAYAKLTQRENLKFSSRPSDYDREGFATPSPCWGKPGNKPRLLRSKFLDLSFNCGDPGFTQQ